MRVKLKSLCVDLGSFLIVTLTYIVLSYFNFNTDSTKIDTIKWSLLLIPILSLGILRDHILRGFRKIVLGQLTEQIFKPYLFIMFLLFFRHIYVNNQITPKDAIIIHLIAAVVAFIIGLFIYYLNQPKSLKNIKPAFENKKWLLSILPLGLLGALQIITSYVDILLIGIIRSDTEVGLYKVAAQFAFLIEFVLISINSVASPYFSRLYALREIHNLQRLVTKSSQIIFSLAIFMFVSLFAFGERIIDFTFGVEFSEAYFPLIIIGIGQVINAMIGSAGMLLNMTGNEVYVSKGIAISAVVNIILGLVLIPKYGVNGAAFSTMISLVVWNLLLWRSVYNILHIQTLPFKRVCSLKG